MIGRLPIAIVVACTLGAGLASAQARFETVTESTIAGAPGLRLIAVRDNALKTCYVVFIADTGGSPGQVSGLEVPSIPDAIASRDRRLAELLHGFENERGAIPGTIIPNPMKYEWLADTAQLDFALTVLAREFMRLEQQIERASAAASTAITAVPAPCTPPVAATSSTEHLSDKRR